MNRNLYRGMKEAVKVSETKFITDDGWMEALADCYTTSDDFLNLNDTRVRKSRLTLAFNAEVVAKDAEGLQHAKDRLVDNIYNYLYGDSIKRLSELSWHVRNGDRAVAEKLLERLYNDIIPQDYLRGGYFNG